MSSYDIVLKGFPIHELPEELIEIFHTVPQLKEYFNEDPVWGINLPPRHDKYFVAAVKLASLALPANTVDNPFYIETIAEEKYTVLEVEDVESELGIKEIIVLESQLKTADTPSDETEFLKLEDISDLLHSRQIHPAFDYYRCDREDYKLPSMWIPNPHIKGDGYYFYRPTVDVDQELITGKYKVIDINSTPNLIELFDTEVSPIRTVRRYKSTGYLDGRTPLITSNFILITESGATYGIQYYAMDYDFAGVICIPEHFGHVFNESGISSESDKVRDFANLVITTVVNEDCREFLNPKVYLMPEQLKETLLSKVNSENDLSLSKEDVLLSDYVLVTKDRRVIFAVGANSFNQDNDFTGMVFCTIDESYLAGHDLVLADKDGESVIDFIKSVISRYVENK